DASRPRLLRRVTFDLIGLPPAPQELDAFLADASPDAFAKVVDQLLASPRFGERWGRHWLDVARYAESSGKTNFTYPQAWRYRDWRSPRSTPTSLTTGSSASRSPAIFSPPGTTASGRNRSSRPASSPSAA